MSSPLKKFWKVISTGWVIEYPDEENGPRDFFDKRDRTRRGGKSARKRNAMQQDRDEIREEQRRRIRSGK